METKYIRTLVTIIENGSFQSAATKLHYSQSTVTFQIQQLEKELGIKLFERIGKKMVITESAKRIIPNLKSILDNYDMAMSLSVENDLRGSLTITMPESVLLYLVTPILQEYSKLAPRVKLSIETLTCDSVRERVVSGYSDIGFHYNLIGTNESLVTTHINDYSLSLVVSSDSKINEKQINSTNSLLNYTYVKNESNSHYQKLLEEYFRNSNIEVFNVIKLTSIEAIKKAVISNVGFTFLPTFCVRKEIDNCQLVEINNSISNEATQLFYVMHKNKVITPAIQLFLDLVNKYMK